MKPDNLFVIAGIAIVCMAVALRIRNHRRSGWGDGVACMLWTCLGAGLLVQGFAPNLRIERERFLLPTPSVAKARINPVELVKRERQMQTLSAVLTGGATLGLALRYRTLLSRPICRQDKTSALRTSATS